MNIIGLSAFYHDAACCLVQRGTLVAAASEERFSRIKNDPRLPVQAFRYCLQAAGLSIPDVDMVAYYEDPVKKLARQLYSARLDRALPDPNRPQRLITELLGYQGRVVCYDHHASHAASSFLYSPFDQAAVLTVDGVGEWASTSYGLGMDGGVKFFEDVNFPHSLGLFYATITAYLGFQINSGEYKVMGLAPYGKPAYVDKLRELIQSNPADGQYQLNGQFFDFVRGDRMYSQELVALLGQPPRTRESEITSFHHDVARSLQYVLEEILLEKVNYLHRCTRTENLCMAGGVALNCVANARILRDSPFKKLFIQPAAGDAGAALGAAALAWKQHGGSNARVKPMQHAYLGPTFSNDDIREVINDCSLPLRNYLDRETELLQTTADLIAADKVVGWFQGAMEFGPRALGARSILANPTSPTIRDRLNDMVKKRESFRPFAPSVLAEHASKHFQLDHASPYMLETCQVASALDLPGITHVDGSARPQTVDAQTNPRFAALIEAFFTKTGCPMVVNTSFNVRDEPIVATPVDALRCMSHANLDALVMGDFLILKEDLPARWAELLPFWETVRRSAFGGQKNVLSEHLYTFV